MLEGEDENIEQAIGRLTWIPFTPFGPWKDDSVFGMDIQATRITLSSISIQRRTNSTSSPGEQIVCSRDTAHQRNDRYDPLSVKKQGLIAHRLYQLESGRQRYRQARTAMLQPPRLPMVNGSTSPVWNYPLKSRKTFFDDGHGAPLPPTMVRLFSTRDTRIREAQECESKVPLPFCLNRQKYKPISHFIVYNIRRTKIVKSNRLSLIAGVCLVEFGRLNYR